MSSRVAPAGFCRHRKPQLQRLGAYRPDLAKGDIGGPLYLAGFEEQGTRSLPQDGSATVWQCVERSVTRAPTKQAVGARRLLKVHEFEEAGKKLEKLELENQYHWLSYEEYLSLIDSFASGLVELTGLPAKARMIIYAETQRDWMVAALAACSRSIEVVTIYATLGEEGAMHGFNQTHASVAVVDAKLMKTLVKIRAKCPSLAHLITLTPCEDATKALFAEGGVQVWSFDEVVDRGRAAKLPRRPPAPEDVAVVMYTSGTTATPKGVLLSNANLVAGVAGFQEAAKRTGIGASTVYMAYLPLAHIMEMIAEISVLSLGASMGYGTPHTLVESGVKLKRPESQGDASVLSPTFIVCPPAVLDRIYKRILEKIDAKGSAAKWMFNRALSAGISNYENGGVGAGSIRGILFKSIQRLLGGRCDIVLSGSAPLSPEIQRFIQTVLNCPVRQGYGLTETCACATLGTLHDNTVKDVGPPQASAVIRLADWPEGNYLNSDAQRADVGMPRGEVLVGGPTVCLGYLVDKENPDPEVVKKNEEDFVIIDGVRYFRTGDVGRITPQGTLQIIDRKKDLWKGPQGEYVALSKVEAAVKLSPYVEIPMVYGKTGGEYPVALVCPNEHYVRKFAKDRGLEVTAPLALCRNPQVLAEVQTSIHEACKQSKLVEFEIPRRIALIPSVDGQPAWTVENGMLTAALKLKRPIISEAFREDIDGLYSPL